MSVDERTPASGPPRGAPRPPLAPPPPLRVLESGVGVREGVEYACVLGFRPLLLDLYLPAQADEPPPVVLFLHGGGWGLGSRRSVCPPLDGWTPSPFERLAAAGLAVASVDYRLTGESRFPAQLQDAAAAARWVRAQGGQLGVDGDRIVAWGASAGGHLAALLGLTAERRELDADEVDDRLVLRGVIDWYGPTDLVHMEAQSDGSGPMEHDSPGSPEGQLIGGRVSELPEQAAAASPITYVHSGAPPFQIRHGACDRGVPPAQSESLAAALVQAGVEVDFELVADADHMWIGAADTEAIFAEAVAFARRVTAA